MTRPDRLDAGSVAAMHRNWVSLAIMAMMIAVGQMVSGSFSAVQESVKAEMGLSDLQLSLVQGLAPGLAVALLMIPVGFLVDHANRVRLLTCFAALWTVGTFATAFAANLSVLFAGRIFIGIGLAGAGTCATSLMADLYLPAHRGRAQLVLSLGRSAGMAASYGAVGWLFGIFGDDQAYGLAGVPWRSVHLVLGMCCCVAMVPLLMLREPARTEVIATPQRGLSAVMGELRKRAAFLIPLIGGATGAIMADTSAAIWAAPVLQRNYGLTPDQFGGWMAIALFGSGVLGSVIGGLSADIGQRSGKRGGPLRGALIAGVVAVFAAPFSLSASPAMFAFGLGLLLLCGMIVSLVAGIAITVLVPNELRGVCLGLYGVSAGVFGLAGVPTLVTLVSEALGGEQHLSMALAIVNTVASVLSLCALLLAAYRAPAPGVIQGGEGGELPIQPLYKPL